MSSHVNRVLSHCYRLSDLASRLEAAAHPCAKALGSAVSVDFRRGFAEEGRTPPPQSSDKQSGPRPVQSESPPGGGDRASDGAGPSQAADDSATAKLKAQGLLDFREVLDNTFKLLKSESKPSETPNPIRTKRLCPDCLGSIQIKDSHCVKRSWLAHHILKHTCAPLHAVDQSHK